MKNLFRILAASALVALTFSANAASAALDSTTDRIVVKYKDSGRAQILSASSRDQAQTQTQAQRLSRVSAIAGVNVQGVVKTTATGATVFQLEGRLPLARVRAIASQLAADGNVQYAEPDAHVHALGVTNDPNIGMQWPLKGPTEAVGGANFLQSWALAGTRKVPVAVVDSGILVHTDLAANVLPGYDFVTDTATAGDGDGRDADPTDPGDFCASSNVTSDWHGLKVAGLLAAVANNGIGVAGAAAYNAQVVPVRVLGRCGGYLSDVADGISWAVGADVAGIPTNVNPVKVVNLSLGAGGGTPCYDYLQEAVDTATAHGAVVVAAAGNDGATQVEAPANCRDVISVGAHTVGGDLAAYSNRGSGVTLTAPGGGACAVMTACDQTPTMTLGNDGSQTVGANQDLAYFSGTSAATPHVSAAAVLLFAANPLLTPAQVKDVLTTSARAHPAASSCTLNPGSCGAGMLDTVAALQQVTVPGVSVVYPSRAVAGGTVVQLTASVSGNASLFTYHWVQKSGPAVTLTGADSAMVSFTAPAVKQQDIVLTVQVTSRIAVTASQDVTVKVNNAPTMSLPATAVAQEGVSLSVPLTANDVDGDPLTFDVSGVTGAQVVDGKLVWANPQRTNTSRASQTFTIVVTATDGSGDGSGDVTQSIAVEVDAAPASSGGGSSGGTTSGSGSTSGGSTSTGGSSGGGGGSESVLGLLALAAAAAFRRRT